MKTIRLIRTGFGFDTCSYDSVSLREQSLYMAAKWPGKVFGGIALLEVRALKFGPLESLQSCRDGYFAPPQNTPLKLLPPSHITPGHQSG